MVIAIIRAIDFQWDFRTDFSEPVSFIQKACHSLCENRENDRKNLMIRSSVFHQNVLQSSIIPHFF